MPPWIAGAAYVAGLLTILSPCVWPVLPFVLARSGRPFRSHGLPLLAGMALAFAGAASLAAVAGERIAALDDWARGLALVVLGASALGLLLPQFATWMARPFVALGERLVGTAHASSVADGLGGWMRPFGFGAALGLLWTPCAGPVLGLVFTGAAIQGPSVQTASLLFVYALGACTPMALVLIGGHRLASGIGASLRMAGAVRMVTGALALLAVVAVAAGWDRTVLQRWTPIETAGVEQAVLGNSRQAPQATPASLAAAVAPAAKASLAAAAPHGAAASQAAPASPATAVPPAPAPASHPVADLLRGATGWLNAPALQAADLQGKVVLVHFWTYSCINCLRALPAIQAWAETYRSAGLAVVGVHTPEFAFEKRTANVSKALEQLGVRHPIALDNDFAIWRGFGNNAWPALYVFDANGRLRHRHAGEGHYEETEVLIRRLLQEAGQRAVPQGMAVAVADGVKAPASSSPWRSPETYLGYAQASGFAGGALQKDRFMAYVLPSSVLRANTWALAGGWTVRAEHADAEAAGARIALRFVARDVHVVMGLRDEGAKPVRFRVLLDGKPPGEEHGTDVDAQGYGVVDGQRLYQLVRAREGGRERTVEVEFLEEGVQGYAVTFG